MTDMRAQLIDWIDEDRDVFLEFLGDFVRAKSPNPPGDTREAGALVERFLSDRKLPFRIIAPNPEMPNYVGNFQGSRPGRHVVFNGHIDVFPLGDAGIWTTGTAVVAITTTITTPNGATAVITVGVPSNGSASPLTLVTPTFVNAFEGLAFLPLFTSFTLDNVVIPEPGTLLLLGSGVAGLLLAGRQRRS